MVSIYTVFNCKDHPSQKQKGGVTHGKNQKPQKSIEERVISAK